MLCRQRPIHRRRADGSSNGARYPRSFRPAGCTGPRNGICARSLSCLLVAEPLPSDLFLSAKYLRFAANEAVRSARPVRPIRIGDRSAAPIFARMCGRFTHRYTWADILPGPCRMPESVSQLHRETRGSADLTMDGAGTALDGALMPALPVRATHACARRPSGGRRACRHS
jgi:hypothetical protein